MTKILVVDDDPLIPSMIAHKLGEAGYEVWTAYSGPQALRLIEERGLPHLILVDLHMPGMDGFTLCKAIKTTSDVPIIILTAVDQEDTIIQALNLYAEDYLVKPFSLRELQARIERVLKRFPEEPLGPMVIIDDRLKLDLSRQLAMVEGQEIPLSQTELKILQVLLRHAGRPLPASYIIQQVWNDNIVSENTLRVNIYRLRRKLEPDPTKPIYLLTEHSTGYRFNFIPHTRR